MDGWISGAMPELQSWSEVGSVGIEKCRQWLVRLTRSWRFLRLPTNVRCRDDRVFCATVILQIIFIRSIQIIPSEGAKGGKKLWVISLKESNEMEKSVHWEEVLLMIVGMQWNVQRCEVVILFSVQMMLMATQTARVTNNSINKGISQWRMCW